MSIFPSLHHRRGAQARQRAASRKGGEAASSRRCREATDADADGVVFLFVLTWKTTPASLSADAPRHFIDCSATPPCGDARRGITRTTVIRSHMLCPPPIGVHRFHRSPLQ